MPATRWFRTRRGEVGKSVWISYYCTSTPAIAAQPFLNTDGNSEFYFSTQRKPHTLLANKVNEHSKMLYAHQWSCQLMGSPKSTGHLDLKGMVCRYGSHAVAAIDG